MTRCVQLVFSPYKLIKTMDDSRSIAELPVGDLMYLLDKDRSSPLPVQSFVAASCLYWTKVRKAFPYKVAQSIKMLFSHVRNRYISEIVLDEYELTLVIVIDYATDAVIQTSLRTELQSDVTLITIAHRLQTIMDFDKIVRDAQRIDARYF